MQRYFREPTIYPPHPYPYNNAYPHYGAYYPGHYPNYMFHHYPSQGRPNQPQGMGQQGTHPAPPQQPPYPNGGFMSAFTGENGAFDIDKTAKTVDKMVKTVNQTVNQVTPIVKQVSNMFNLPKSKS